MSLRKMSIPVCITLLLCSGGLQSATSQDWSPQTSGTANLLDAVWFTDALNGWTVGDAGTSLFTNDGGTTWNQIVLTAQDLGGVAFLDASIGLIVGDNGVIFRTINGGATWTPVASGTGVNLDAVAFGGGGFACAGGRDGTILRSADNGASWNVVETGGNERYRDAAATGTSAWMIGDGGAIRATTNSGVSWFTQNGGTANDLRGVFFLDSQEGWIAGNNDTMIYTNNGGTTWTPRATGINVGPDAVFFVDSNEGWAVGDVGSVFHTTNGGLQWLPETSNTGNGLNDVHFVGAAHGWAVGDLGTVIFRGAGPADAQDEFEVSQALTLGNHPNPFTPFTDIRFTLPRDQDVSLRVFAPSGRVVRTLIEGTSYTPGTHHVSWDGRDDTGRRVSSGTYFYRLTAGARAETNKMTLRR